MLLLVVQQLLFTHQWLIFLAVNANVMQYWCCFTCYVGLIVVAFILVQNTNCPVCAHTGTNTAVPMYGQYWHPHECAIKINAFLTFLSVE